MDLDELLDDVDMSTLKSQAVKPSAKAAAKKAQKFEEKPKPVQKVELLSKEIRPWLAASANCPKELRDKWTKMVKVDTEAELCSKLQPSSAYCEWGDPATIPKRGVNKSLQELVRTAAARSGLSEQQATKIVTLVNPVTDSERGAQLNAAFTKELIRDLRVDLTADPNYDPRVYTNLAAALGK
jgi:hypothetical protein